MAVPCQCRPQESLGGSEKLFMHWVPMNSQQCWKTKLERAHSFRVQSGKITVCTCSNRFLHSALVGLTPPHFTLNTKQTFSIFIGSPIAIYVQKIQKSFVHFLRKVLLCAPKCINIKWCTTPRQYCIASPMIKSIFNAHSNSIFRRGYIFAEDIHAVASGQRSTEQRRHAQDWFGDLFDFLYHLVC